jgi:hypothetical protein
MHGAYILRRSAIVAVMLLIVAFAWAVRPETANAAVPTQAAGHFAAYTGGNAVPLVESPVITAGSCKYRQAVDNPHGSGGDASVHGWWLISSGPCPHKATVTAYLQAWWCDLDGCRWITVSTSPRADVYAGGGKGKRATARKACASSKTVGWRGYVDVNLDNWHDPSGYTYGTAGNLACSPPD